MNRTLVRLFVLLPLAGCTSTQNTTVQQVPPVVQQKSLPTEHVSPSQPFDYYLLNLSWSPEFCTTHPSAVECPQHLGFILHGLWPQENSGKYLENCSAAPGPTNPSTYTDLCPDPGLLQHEWKTHGTCSGLGPDAYFTLARTVVHSVRIPATLVQLHQQISLPPGKIIALFQKANPNFPATSLTISCGNNHLTAVEVCMNKSGQVVACGPIRSCRANTIRITPPGGS